METLYWLVDLFLHLDKHVKDLVHTCGWWTYLLLFAVVFCETGLVVTPFLPGDSLLFAAGTAAGLGMTPMNPHALFVLLAIAAILGDTVNYWIGRKVGPKVFSRTDVRFLNRKHLERTHAFYERHGGKTIIIARFLPIIRTFAPFVAGIGQMNYVRFISYNIIGGVAWVGVCIGAGWLFGSHPWVQKNFSVVIMAMVIIPGLPALIEFLRGFFAKKPGPAAS